MGRFQDLGSKLNSLADNAGKKSGELVEQARLNADISRLQADIEDLQFELGKAYYEQYRDNPAGPFEETVRQVIRCEQEIRQRNIRLLALKGMMYCPGCDLPVGVGDGFCSRCGTPLPKPKLSQEEDNCPNCEAPLCGGQAYCPKCGYLVHEEQV